jgi:pimeloyl-ACP methyl ester carboxylesterase
MGTSKYVPKPVLSSIVGSVFVSIGSSMASLPTTWVMGGLRSKLSKEEQKVFDDKNADPQDFAKMMKWMREDGGGGAGDDVAVLLSKGEDLGIDYKQISETHTVYLWHAENDTMVPYAGAEWLSQQIPSARLHQLPGGSHEGAMFLLYHPMFLLYPSIVDSFQWLVPGEELKRE